MANHPPNAAEHNPDPSYIRKLIHSTGLTQVQLAKLLGVSDRAIKYWVSGQKPYPYTVQFAIERLV